MLVDKDKFNQVIDNLLKMPPKKRSESRLGTRKKSEPKTEAQPECPPESDKLGAE
jgi:hypothetical protein